MKITFIKEKRKRGTFQDLRPGAFFALISPLATKDMRKMVAASKNFYVKLGDNCYSNGTAAFNSMRMLGDGGEDVLSYTSEESEVVEFEIEEIKLRVKE